MKRLSLPSVLLLLSFAVGSMPAPASAQRMFLRRPFEKGTLIWSGSFSFSSSGGDLYADDGDREIQLSFNPSLSYFVTSGLAIGIQTSISYRSRGDQAYTSLGAGPECSYYFRKRGANPQVPIAKGSLIPYFSAGLLFVGTSGTTASTWGEYEYKSNGTNLNIGAGCLYMMSPRYAIFLRAGYEFHWRSQTNSGSRTGNRFVLSAGLSAFAL